METVAVALERVHLLARACEPLGPPHHSALAAYAGKLRELASSAEWADRAPRLKARAKELEQLVRALRPQQEAAEAARQAQQALVQQEAAQAVQQQEQQALAQQEAVPTPQAADAARGAEGEAVCVAPAPPPPPPPQGQQPPPQQPEAAREERREASEGLDSEDEPMDNLGVDAPARAAAVAQAAPQQPPAAPAAQPTAGPGPALAGAEGAAPAAKPAQATGPTAAAAPAAVVAGPTRAAAEGATQPQAAPVQAVATEARQQTAAEQQAELIDEEGEEVEVVEQLPAAAVLAAEGQAAPGAAAEAAAGAPPAAAAAPPDGGAAGAAAPAVAAASQPKPRLPVLLLPGEVAWNRVTGYPHWPLLVITREEAIARGIPGVSAQAGLVMVTVGSPHRLPAGMAAACCGQCTLLVGRSLRAACRPGISKRVRPGGAPVAPAATHQAILAHPPVSLCVAAKFSNPAFLPVMYFGMGEVQVGCKVVCCRSAVGCMNEEMDGCMDGWVGVCRQRCSAKA